MRYETPLVPGRLLRRYKRFLADVHLDTGEEVTAHCPNPGAMLGLTTPGMRIWLEPNSDPKKKLKYGWRMSELGEDGELIGIDTSVPNRIVGDALRARKVPELAAYSNVRAEVKYGINSRIDFLLREPGLPDAYVEVKNVHLVRNARLAEFPDCVTQRGAKHLRELSDMVAQGHKAFMFFCVQYAQCDSLAIADDLDPAYGQAYVAARAAGVETIAYNCALTHDEIRLHAPLRT